MSSPASGSAIASTLRIASRRSQLAMVQTHWVRDELIKAIVGRGKVVTDMVLKQEYAP